MDRTSVVIIPLDRYTELIQLEARVDTIVDRFYRNDIVTNEELLSALGTELSVELADKMRLKREGVKVDGSKN